MPKGIYVDPATVPPKVCAACDKEFFYMSGIGLKAWNAKRFCSMACFSGQHKPWQGKKRDPETRRKMSENRRGKGANQDHHGWKGDEAGYAAIHQWVARRMPLSGVCSECGASGKTQRHNIDGLYRRDLADWAEVCVGCNRKAEVRMRRCPHCDGLLYATDLARSSTPTFARSRNQEV